MLLAMLAAELAAVDKALPLKGLAIKLLRGALLTAQRPMVSSSKHMMFVNRFLFPSLSYSGFRLCQSLALDGQAKGSHLALRGEALAFHLTT